MNNFGSLYWEFETPTTETTFLDLSIKFVQKYINYRTNTDFYTVQFKTYPKTMNLYLYIPPHSAHPPGTIQSLIYSQTRKYWFQNTNTNDFKNMVQTFFIRLINRGHNKDKLHKLFTKTSLAPYTFNHQHSFTDTTNQTPPRSNDSIYLKWRFHPDDLPRTTIRCIYHQTCANRSLTSPQGFRELPTNTGEMMNVNRLTIAYTRDRNLQDLFISSRLHNSEKYSINKFISSSKKRGL